MRLSVSVERTELGPSSGPPPHTPSPSTHRGQLQLGAGDVAGAEVDGGAHRDPPRAVQAGVQLLQVAQWKLRRCHMTDQTRMLTQGFPLGGSGRPCSGGQAHPAGVSDEL
jgi:hypothetical protein